jgi:hypothetical protein
VPDLSRAEQLRVIERDRGRCLRCGRRPATFQHRRAKGMGGVGPTAAPLTLADGCALCWDCNNRAESDLQQDCLEHGWKVRRFCSIPTTRIPVYDALTGNWWLLDESGGRSWIAPADAEALIHAAMDG